MRKLILLVLLLSCVSFLSQAQVKPDLGSAAAYTVLAKTSVQNVGDTKIDGNVGGNSLSGFMPNSINGSQEVASPAADQAQAHLQAAYNQVASQVAPPANNLSGTNLGNRTLGPGIYKFDDAADLSGILTLDNGGNPNAIFIFQIGGNLTVAGGAEVKFLEAASPRIHNIFWQVNGQVSLGANAVFRGSLLTNGDIQVATGATVRGRLLTQQGAIHLNTNIITVPTDLSVTQTKSDGIRSPDIYSIGETVTFTVTARNEGPVTGKNVRVRYELNSGFDLVSATPSSGLIFDPALNRWIIASFPVNATATLQIVAKINGSRTESFSNNAGIAGDGVDELQDNNNSAIQICVAPAAPAKITGPLSVCIDAAFDYSVPVITGAASYTWAAPFGWEILSGQNTAAIRVKIGPEAEDGQITVTVGNTCAVSEPSKIGVTVSDTPPPTPGPITPGPAGSNPCISQVTATYAIDPVATATSYFWTAPAGWKITDGQGTTAITVEIGTGAGEITVQTLNGCVPPNAPQVLAVTASVTPPTPPTDIIGDLQPCIGKEATYSVSGGSDATSYKWTLPEGAGWVFKPGTDQTARTVVVITGSTAGVIIVIGINGCGATEEFPLTLNPISNTPPAAITGPLNPCLKSEGNTYSVPMVPGATSYFWSASGGLEITEGQLSNSIKVKVGENMTSGDITVTAFNNCGPSTSITLKVTPAKLPDMPGAITGASAQPCAGPQPLVYSILPVTGATSYIWTVPAGWEIAGDKTGTAITATAGTAAGVISVRAVINNCTPGPARTLAVTPSVAVPAGKLQISGEANLCVSDDNKSYQVAALADVTAYAWVVPADWKILSGQGTTQIRVKVGATSGDVKVTAVNNCGDGLASTMGVTVSTSPSPAPGPIISSTALPCVQQANITYSVPAITGAFSYNWEITGGWQITGGNGTTAITVTAGTGPATLSVKAVNACGESGTSTLQVTPTSVVPPVPVAITGSSVVCVNQTNLAYSVAVVTEATTYFWTVPAGWQILTGAGTSSITVRAGTQGGTVSVAAGNNCGKGSAQVQAVQISTLAPATPGPISGTGNLCAGKAGTTFTIAPVSGATAYTWTVPAGWIITSGQGTPSLVVTTGSVAGKIKVKSVNGCGESTDSELEVKPTEGLPPTPGAILASVAEICAGGKNLAYAVAPLFGVSIYNWQVPAGWEITSGQGTPAITVTAGSAAGQVSVTAFNNCGAGSASSLAVQPGVIPTAPVAISGQLIPCAGSTGNTYSVPPVPGAATYAWQVPAGWIITSGQGTPSITVAAGTGSGEISLVASNNCGNSTLALLAVKAAVNVPAVPGTIAGSSSVCGSSLDLTYTYSVAAETNAANYIWTVPNNWVITSGQGTLNITVKASTSPGTISVMSENGCGLSQVSFLPVSVTGQAPPAPGPIAGNARICAGTADLSYSIGSVSGAASYVWTVPADWTITAGQGTTSIKVTTGNTAGEVLVAAVNGCGQSSATSRAVTLNAIPAMPLAITGDLNQCAGNAGSIYQVEPVTGAVSYTWTVPADWIITAGQGTRAITVTAGQVSGSVSVTANSDCGSSAGLVLAVTSSTTPSPAPGTITPAYSGLICSQQSGLTYSIEPIATANAYAWVVPDGWTITSGQGTTSIKVTAGAGSGAIAVKAINGCGESAASALPVVPTQTASVSIGDISGEQEVCSGRTGLVYAIAPVAGATNYHWLVPAGWQITAGQGTTQVTLTAGTDAGDISVTAANNCTSSLASLLTARVNALPVAPVAISDVSSPCAGLRYTIQPVADAQSYTWMLPEGWIITAGAGTTDIQVTAPAGSGKGIIQVVTNSGACSSAPVFLDADPGRADADLTIANVFSPNGDRVNDTWEILNVQNYPDNDLVIINRWGNEVYRRTAYRNQWDGGELSAGTYFYVLKMKVCDGSYKTYKGYVMIMR